ncbi:putative nucleolar protein 10/Enp2 [Helianthus debilis subsp. tardiflorus]
MERVDLIQDLRFETATTRIKATPDGEFLIASGYWLREVSSSDDYSKLAFLCADRSVNLHAAYGSHYSLRIPRFLTVSHNTFLYLHNAVFRS